MFKTFQGVTEDAKNTVYLRPETAQGIFVNFKNVARTSRKKIPFGIGQIGKSFRNEITPGNFTFRTREFEQMELEFFCEPGTDMEWFQYWRGFCRDWLLSLGIKEDEMRLRDHSPEELCFYSKGTTDIEFLFPFGWGELWGVADRTDYDLTQHQTTSGKDMTYFDQAKNEHYIPYVIEPSLGADRVVLAFLVGAVYFGVMAVYGATTNRSLVGWGPKLMGGLIAMIICSLVGSLFSLFGFSFGIGDLLLCAVGLFLFMGLTAYDTQMLKHHYAYFGGDAAMLHKASIIGALNLYLDFINIFLYVVRLLGRRRDS